jgi:glutaconate CoA-transferase subunit B
VTPLCVFRRRDARLVVESVHPTTTPAAVVDRTGFALSTPDTWPETPPPTEAELTAITDLDPERVRRLEFA